MDIEAAVDRDNVGRKTSVNGPCYTPVRQKGQQKTEADGEVFCSPPTLQKMFKITHSAILISIYACFCPSTMTIITSCTVFQICIASSTVRNYWDINFDGFFSCQYKAY